MRLETTAIDIIWDELMAGHLTTDMAGERLTAAAANAGLGTTATRDAVWNAVRATYATVGTFGEVTASSDLVDDIWDEEIVAAHATTATAGERLTAAGNAGAAADQWATATTNAAYTSTQFGGRLNALVSSRASSTQILTWALSTDMASVLTASSAIQAKTTNLPATPASSTSFLNWAMSTDMASVLTASSAIQAKTTNLPATPASSTDIKAFAMSTDLGTALTALTAIEAATTTLPAAPAGSSNFTTLMTSTGSTAMADAVWNVISESTQSYAQQIRNMRAALAGKATGGGTASISFRDVADTINRLTFTATTEGNRTAVVLVTT
jgi:hypothetical protein